jgi:hypothetical protein
LRNASHEPAISHLARCNLALRVSSYYLEFKFGQAALAS